MTRTEEKLRLAEELGIEGYVQTQKQALKDAIAREEREAVIKELTGMKWKPLTKDSFKWFPKWKWGGWDTSTAISPLTVFTVTAVIVGGVSMLLAAGANQYLNIPDNYCWLGVLVVTTLASTIMTAFGFTHKVEVASMPLSDWKDDLPYGALLAVKEARWSGVVGVPMRKSMGGGAVYWNGESGIKPDTTSFKIYYPRLEARRVNADPIITGFYKGIEVEIFAWDDKKIRPEDY